MKLFPSEVRPGTATNTAPSMTLRLSWQMAVASEGVPEIRRADVSAANHEGESRTTWAVYLVQAVAPEPNMTM